MKIQCPNCKRIIDVPENWDKNATCSKCGSYFVDPRQNYGVSKQFQQIGQQFQGSVPHIMLGKGGLSTNRPQQQQIHPQPRVISPNPPQNPYPQPQPYLPPQMPYSPPETVGFPYKSAQDRRAAKIKEIAFYACIALVVGYVIYRILF